MKNNSRLSRLICITWLSLHFLPVLHALAQDSLKQPTPAEQAKEALKAIRTKLPIHTRPAVRREAFRTMAAISRASDHASAAATHLTKGINDPAPDVSVACLDGLARLGPVGMAELPNAIESFKSKEVKIPAFVRAAIGMIGAFAPEDKRLIPILIGALDDPDTGTWKELPGANSVSMFAMIRLEPCKATAEAAVPKLLESLNGKKWSDVYQGRLLSTLIAIDPQHPLIFKMGLEYLNNKKNPQQIMRGAGILSAIGPLAKPAIPDLIAVLKMEPLADRQLEIRLKAVTLSAFRSMGPAAKDALPFLRTMPALGDPEMRLYVEQALESIGGKNRK
jgi:hypothetical protein